MTLLFLFTDFCFFCLFSTIMAAQHTKDFIQQKNSPGNETEYVWISRENRKANANTKQKQQGIRFYSNKRNVCIFKVFPCNCCDDSTQSKDNT